MESFHVLTPFLLIIWLILVPLLSGFLLSALFPEEKRTEGMVWLSGLLLSFVLFQPLAIYCMIRIIYDSFYRFTWIYTAIMLLLAAGGLIRLIVTWVRCDKDGWSEHFLALFPGHCVRPVADLYHPRRDPVRVDRRFSRSELLYFSVFLILLAIQLVMAVLYAPFDGDDAYYIVESVQAQQTNTMNTLQPYLGYSTALDYRHALAEYPLWIAYIARMSLVHATIFAHTILPLFWIPVSYAVYAAVARFLFRKRTDLIPLFLCFLALFSMFGNVSIYTPETFFLMRTWQGKSVVGNLVIPAVFLFFFHLADQERDQNWRSCSRRQRLFPWLLLFLINVTAGFLSTSGILVVTMLIFAGLFFIAAFGGGGSLKHRLGLLFWGGLTCIPNAILVLMGFVLKPF